MATRIFLALLGSCAVIGGCSQSRPSAITPGAAKKHIEPGITTQAEVIEVFGSPNILTRKDGGEMWVYDKVSSRTTYGAFGLGGGGGGIGSGGAGGGLAGGSVGSMARSETTVMLIVYFDENDVVRDYKITQTKF
jgi:outer membrane protein assembly factor BamE (lipoprotein component of BamABCDE complex)